MELFEHQKTGIEFLKKTKKCILADEMGLGKTRQAIVAAGNDAKIIVVCPASLKINWRREIWSVYPSADIAILQTDICHRPLLTAHFARGVIILVNWPARQVCCIAYGKLRSFIYSSIYVSRILTFKDEHCKALAQIARLRDYNASYCS